MTRQRSPREAIAHLRECPRGKTGETAECASRLSQLKGSSEEVDKAVYSEPLRMVPTTLGAYPF